ncbi:unnamed protein product [Bursaphelenchus okinawaensis]|uniref:Uncharacterized protein n=1 Tax=Bursaphelenchus okinawaensis TaxID=465554 RepID=A0A811JS49_9BILA|nr:unnamed protein product [Bursaphelenchus okinawaensis]CAG9080594.1 unnamed protein product [Bursaphelenchus okinawaensis]
MLAYAIFLYVTEMLLNTFALVVHIMFLFILSKTKLFLNSQRYYIGNVILANIVTIVFRYPQLVQILAEQPLYSDELNTVITEVHNLADSAVTNMLAQITIFVDVTVVIMGRDETALSVAIVLCVLMWAVGYYIYTVYNSMFEVLEVLNLICWFTFFGLIYIGRTKYRQLTNGNVNNKYKLSVCLRTLAVLKVMAVCSAIKNFVCINDILVLNAFIRPYKDVFGEQIASFVYDLTLSVYSSVVPFLMIWSHEQMKKTYGRLYSTNGPKLEVVSIEKKPRFVARNVVGDVITHLRPQEEEAQHFAHLQSSWNTLRVPGRPIMVQ